MKKLGIIALALVAAFLSSCTTVHPEVETSLLITRFEYPNSDDSVVHMLSVNFGIDTSRVRDVKITELILHPGCEQVEKKILLDNYTIHTDGSTPDMLKRIFRDTDKKILYGLYEARPKCPNYLLIKAEVTRVSGSTYTALFPITDENMGRDTISLPETVN